MSCPDCEGVAGHDCEAQREAEYIDRYFGGDREAYLRARRVFANERVQERGEEER